MMKHFQYAFKFHQPACVYLSEQRGRQLLRGGLRNPEDKKVAIQEVHVSLVVAKQISMDAFLSELNGISIFSTNIDAEYTATRSFTFSHKPDWSS